MCSLSTSNIRISVVGKYGKYAVGNTKGFGSIPCSLAFFSRCNFIAVTACMIVMMMATMIIVHSIKIQISSAP